MSLSTVRPIRIAVIGNGGGGKTTLSRSLAALYDVPATHVDSIQFLPGMNIRPLEETRKVLNEIEAQANWLIDGYGPLDMIEKRFERATHVIFIDFAIWRHFWWSTKRQTKIILTAGILKRRELPEGCNEVSLKHTIKLFKTLWRVHKKMRPELLKLLNRAEIAPKVRMIRTLKDWQCINKYG